MSVDWSYSGWHSHVCDPSPVILLGSSNLALWPCDHEFTILFLPCLRWKLLTCSSSSKSIPLPLALKLRSLQQAITLASLLLYSVPSTKPETLLWKLLTFPSTLNMTLSLLSPSWPSLVLWIKFKILALIFVALYNSSNSCWLIIAVTIYLW